MTAGIPTTAPDMPGRAAIPNAPPGIYNSSRTLHRGDTYSVNVYTPRPTEKELRAAGAYYDRNFDDYLTLDVLDPKLKPNPGAPVGPVPVEAHFPEWAARGVAPDVIRRNIGGGDPIAHLDAQKELARSNLKRTWALSQRLRDDADSPVDYVNAVEAYLGGDGFTYTEAPPAKARTLEGFLFDAKTGYCQQYSGAMALLLRMGGVPARVATGFTPGSYDRRAKEYVVRDLDAHSWVEAWFPTYRLGHVRPDAVGRAAALAARRPRRAACRGDVPRPRRRRQRSTRAPARRRPTARRGRSTSAAGSLAALLLAGGAFAFLHRGRYARPAARARARAAAHAADAEPGRDAAGARGRVRPLARRPGYVRALREQRYSGRGDAPTSAQRRGLRRELGRGGGLRGRLRAWWALPPRRRADRAPYNSIGMADVYDLFQRGTALLEAGDFTLRPSRWRRPATSIPTRRRSARRSAARTSAPPSSRPREPSSRRSSSARRPTTTRSSASAARCSSWGAEGGAQGRSRWPPDCVPTARDYRIYRDRARAAA